MPIRWSGAPEPLSIVWTPNGPQAVPDAHKIPLGQRIEIDLGESEDDAIAVKFEGENGAWGWNNKSYFHGGRHPAWPLPTGLVSTRVAVRTGGREYAPQFDIDTSAPLQEFATCDIAH